MKTFETEKGNIPEGATHYYHNVTGIGFYRLINDIWELWSYCDTRWKFVLDNKCTFEGTPIPQTKEVEWVNGDKCVHGHHNYAGASKMTYIGAHPFVVGKHVCLSELKGLIVVDSIWLRKPETEAEMVEREQLEAAYDLYCTALSENKDEIKSFDHFKSYKYKCGWLRIVDKTNYRKESE